MHGIELLGIDYRREAVERTGAAGVARTAAARNVGQPQIDASRYHRGILRLRIGVDDDERISDAPPGAVGYMRRAREPVELNVVVARGSPEPAAHLAAQLDDRAELRVERVARSRRS